MSADTLTLLALNGANFLLCGGRRLSKRAVERGLCDAIIITSMKSLADLDEDDVGEAVCFCAQAISNFSLDF